MRVCLNCGRDLSTIKVGEVEPGGFMLCLGCGHVMAWTDDLGLRDLTNRERIDAGSHGELMRARAKIVPDRSIKHRGTSLVTTAVLSFVVVMAVLEATGAIAPIHSRAAPVWTKSHPHPAWPNSR